MRLFIDTNIFIDVIYEHDGLEASLDILKLCEGQVHDGFISSLSIANAHYICRKTVKSTDLKNALLNIMNIFTVIPLAERDLIKAFNSHLKDYEDALQVVAAENAGADYIITRNIKDFAKSPITALTPEQFLLQA